MSFILLVEGADDQHLIKNLARQHEIDIDLKKETRVCLGIERLLHEDLPVWLKSSEGVIAVVVDADLDLSARWQAVSQRLTSAGYEVPSMPPPDGLILANRRPTVGVWLMPDNSLPGTIEDFATRLIPAGDELWPRAVRAVEAIPAAERRFSNAAVRKAEVHTYLAWQEDPGTPLGLAVTKKYFQSDVGLATRFITWLKALKDQA